MYETIPTNLILAGDSYKVGHHRLDTPGIEYAQGYFGPRSGAKHDEVVAAGLQSIMITYLEGEVVKPHHVERAALYFEAHFPGQPDIFNREGWEYIIDRHKGKLPLRIKAVPEGSVVRPGEVMFTVENTDPNCAWLVGYLETLLSHVWYPSTVATLSREVKRTLRYGLEITGCPLDGLVFMLHDFGCRGASSMETAAIGGMAHLINFSGTDTIPALELANTHYDADIATLAFSIFATEHSIMTGLGLGRDGEVLGRYLKEVPTGIIACVIDSFDPYAFVTDQICGKYRDEIATRDGKFVVRPDSLTERHDNPGDQIVWILDQLWDAFGGTWTQSKTGGPFRVLDLHVGVIWGDGIDPDGIKDIIVKMIEAEYAISNIAFGMGGGLLQKVNRDDERFSFKRCAIKIEGEDDWRSIQKLTYGKTSIGGYIDQPNLVTVFENGHLVNPITFDQVRENAAL